MNTSIQQISDDLITIYRNDKTIAAHDIESYLNKTFIDLPPKDKLKLLEKISKQFSTAAAENLNLEPDTQEQLAKFISLILGRKIETHEISERNLQEKLSKSLNAIFDGLNHLIQAINDTLSDDGQLEETIRYIIHEEIKNHTSGNPLEEYIDKIRESFFTAYKSSKSAHIEILDKVLNELDPEKILSENTGHLKFGPLRKAEAFDSYQKMYKSLHKWHDSGRGLEEYLRTFEKLCNNQKHQHKEVRP